MNKPDSPACSITYSAGQQREFRIMRFKHFAGAAVAVLGLAMASSAFATQTITVTDAEIPNATTIGLSDATAPGINGTFYLGVMQLTDSDGHVYYVDCDAIFNEIGLGGGQNLQYDLITNGVTNDNNGNTLSADTVAHMVWIADVSLNSSDVVTQQAGQAAIWQVEYGPGLHEDFFGNTAVENAALAFETSSNRAYNTNIQFQSTDGHQSFFNAVPEPSTWALMIVGFGGLGAMVRHRRRIAFA